MCKKLLACNILRSIYVVRGKTGPSNDDEEAWIILKVTPPILFPNHKLKRMFAKPILNNVNLPDPKIDACSIVKKGCLDHQSNFQFVLL